MSSNWYTNYTATDIVISSSEYRVHRTDEFRTPNADWQMRISEKSNIIKNYVTSDVYRNYATNELYSPLLCMVCGRTTVEMKTECTESND